MTDDFIDPTPEDAERWTRNLLKGKPVERFDDTEKKMIEKVFGTETAAEHFLRHEGRPDPKPVASRIDLRRNKTYRPPAVTTKFEYWDLRGDPLLNRPEWRIERLENGKKTTVQSGDDWQKRDELLIKYQASGATCTPITVAGVVPQPIKGRSKEKPKPKNGRASIMSQIGTMTAEDLSDFSLDDWKYE